MPACRRPAFRTSVSSGCLWAKAYAFLLSRAVFTSGKRPGTTEARGNGGVKNRWTRVETGGSGGAGCARRGGGTPGRMSYRSAASHGSLARFSYIRRSCVLKGRRDQGESTEKRGAAGCPVVSAGICMDDAAGQASRPGPDAVQPGPWIIHGMGSCNGSSRRCKEPAARQGKIAVARFRSTATPLAGPAGRTARTARTARDAGGKAGGNGRPAGSWPGSRSSGADERVPPPVRRPGAHPRSG
jgi:hypothetical protein